MKNRDLAVRIMLYNISRVINHVLGEAIENLSDKEIENYDSVGVSGSIQIDTVEGSVTVEF